MAIASPIRSQERRGEHGQGEGQGEERAPGAPVTIEELWEHREFLHAVSRRIVGDAATADDVVQETYVRAMRHLDRLDRSQSLRAWLATVARRCSIDELRRQGRHAVPMDELPDAEARSPHELVDALVTRDALSAAHEALSVLQPRERQLLVRRVAEGRTMAELAADEGSTVRAVESVLTRARAKLAAAVDRGAAWALVPWRSLWRSLVSRHAESSLADADLEVLPAGGHRVTEIVAGSVAAAVLAAAMLIGGLGDGDGTRIDASGHPYRRAETPALGSGQSSAVAAVDSAALRRVEVLLASALGAFPGISSDHGTDPDDPDTADDSDRSDDEPPTPGSGDGAANPGGGSGSGGTSGSGLSPRPGAPKRGARATTSVVGVPAVSTTGGTPGTTGATGSNVTPDAKEQPAKPAETSAAGQGDTAPSNSSLEVLERITCVTDECSPAQRVPGPDDDGDGDDNHGGGGGGEPNGLLPIQ